MIDRRRVLDRLSYLSEQRDILASAAERDPSDFEGGDPLVRYGVRYAVQTAIEAMIDICYHISAKQFGHAPQSAHDALDVVFSRGVLPTTSQTRFHQMVGLRNRLVHGYEQISDTQLMQAVKEGVADLDVFVKAVTAFLEA